MATNFLEPPLLLMASLDVHWEFSLFVVPRSLLFGSGIGLAHFVFEIRYAGTHDQDIRARYFGGWDILLVVVASPRTPGPVSNGRFVSGTPPGPLGSHRRESTGL